MLELPSFKNFRDKNGTLGFPWEFTPSPASEAHVKGLPKEARSKWMEGKKANWNLYSGVVGIVPTERVSDNNEAAEIRAVVIDYDATCDYALVMQRVGAKDLKDFPGIHPTFFEQSLSKKGRLVWLLPEPMKVMNSAMAKVFLSEFAKIVKAEFWLPGFDSASLLPQQPWTNGVDWYEVTGQPVSPSTVNAAWIATTKAKGLFDSCIIPMDVVAAEVEKRWPGRWGGEFVEDAVGPRFWDDIADNPKGAQIKPDGMLVFSGPERGTFLKWGHIFGFDWVKAQTTTVLTTKAEGIYWDNTFYWIKREAGKWDNVKPENIDREFRAMGISATQPKGGGNSPADDLKMFIQIKHRVEGAAPFVGYPPGLVQMGDKIFLNTVNLQFALPVKGETGTPTDFPFLNDLVAMFDGGQDNFLSWLKRAYTSLTTYQRLPGQSIYIAGPAGCGKTLLVNRVLLPLLGGRLGDPYHFLVGNSQFSDFLECGLLVIDDKTPPQTDALRRRYTQQVKSLVANERVTFHVKFQKAVMTSWNGRLVVTMNDDNESNGCLPDAIESSMDKMMFFKALPGMKFYPTPTENEAVVAKELPAFLWWLLNDYRAEEGVETMDRMGVVSYFDPSLLSYVKSSHYASTVLEEVAVTLTQMTGLNDIDGTRQMLKKVNPTQLKNLFSGHGSPIKASTHQIYSALMGAASDPESGIVLLDNQRHFSIEPTTFLKNLKELEE